MMKAVAGVGILGAVAASAYMMGKNAQPRPTAVALPAPKPYTTGEPASAGCRDALENVSPLDGRYAKTCAVASPYFSEFGLIKFRIRVEVEYFIALCEAKIPELQNFDLSDDARSKLR